MRLTIVGCAPAYTSRSGHASSCYLVEREDTAVLLDMGQGAFAELWRYRRPDEIAAVFISHMHPDHCIDLVPLRHWVRFENGGRGPALYGPAELRGRFADFHDQPGFLDDLAGEPLEAGTFAVGELRVEAARVQHIPNSFAFRVSVAGADGPGLVYSGDCGAADDLLPLVRAGDTLLCEAAFGTGPVDVPIHLTAQQAASVAARGEAARLVLTHILDSRDASASQAAARAAFSGEVMHAVPGLAIDIG
jgi:ribonuclease BN (tRNA processing enzyme)